MIHSKLHIYTRILVAFVAAILASEFLVREVFISATPNVRHDLADRLVERSLALVNIDNYIAFFRGQQGGPSTNIALQHDPEPYRPTFIKGVYAKETETESITQVRYDEVEWIDIDYQRADGTVETIKIPRGTNPPPPGLF